LNDMALDLAALRDTTEAVRGARHWWAHDDDALIKDRLREPAPGVQPGPFGPLGVFMGSGPWQVEGEREVRGVCAHLDRVGSLGDVFTGWRSSAISPPKRSAP
jgi:hypothetical protein